MISYIDIFFLILAAIMVFANLKKGLVVSILSMIRFVVIIPLSYFLISYVSPLIVPPDALTALPQKLIDIIAFAVCFIALLIISELLLLLLKILQKKKGMPLRNINAVLGGVFGFVKAVLLVFVMSSIMIIVVEFMEAGEPFYDAINNSYAVEFVKNFDLSGLLV